MLPFFITKINKQIVKYSKSNKMKYDYVRSQILHFHSYTVAHLKQKQIEEKATFWLKQKKARP